MLNLNSIEKIVQFVIDPLSHAHYKANMTKN